MVTDQEIQTLIKKLKDFATQNKIKIIPYREIMLDEWAKMILENNGHCLCADERMCPCTESIEEITSKTDGKYAACTCTFYCDNRYIDYWKESWKTQNEQEQEKAEIVTKTEVKSNYEPKIPEIKNAIKVLAKVRDSLAELSGEDTDEIMNTITENETLVMDDAEQHECKECADAMSGIARKLGFLVGECEIDPFSCATERDLTLQRIDALKAAFITVDKTQSGQQETTTDETPIGTTEEPAKTTDEPQDDFHKCTSNLMKTELKEVERGVKMCAAAKMCGKDKLPMDEAIKICREGK
jgi:hypothetical protein